MAKEIGYTITTTSGKEIYVYVKGRESKCDSVTLHNFGIVNGKLTKIY